MSEQPPEKPATTSSGSKSDQSTVESLLNLFTSFRVNADQPKECISSQDLEGIAEYIKSGKAKNIVVMTGAGVSVSAGIPDFRTPGTGLYSNLQKYNLPVAEAIFTLSYFMENPVPFTLLAKEMYPGKYKPTPTHYFIKLLHKKNLLLRNYTQNIDTLERVAGIPGDKLIEAHGSFATNHCIRCKKEYSQEYVKAFYFDEKTPKCTECDGFIKPDIVFFGESLPPVFFEKQKYDFSVCDLLIVMGTSLKVNPFATLIHRPRLDVPRLLINLEVAGAALKREDGDYIGTGFRFSDSSAKRDAWFQGACDEGVFKLAELLGWKEELEALINESAEPKAEMSKSE